MPESDKEFCRCLKKNCGEVSGKDNCGKDRNVKSCGTCPDGKECSKKGRCVKKGCTPQCTGKVCGDDGCGSVYGIGYPGMPGTTSRGHCLSPSETPTSLHCSPPACNWDCVAGIANCHKNVIV